MIDQRNYTYLKAKVSDKTHRIYWRCRQSRQKEKTHYQETCKARATTSGGKILAFTFEHNHPPFDMKLDRELEESLKE